MSSSAGTQQFRYNQTPSKVLHLRNLPWECTEDELIDLCTPFGKIVQTKPNVGANRNQAFVEFAEQNQAISMVSYFASASDAAQIRGKTVYIQYSNRDEIVNSKSPGDIPGNVLLISMEGVQPGDVTIETIHLVFSTFGYVHKIATFEKAAGFQALIQFSDLETATAAKDALDGRSIPRYLLPEHVSSCNLKISFSAHVDLNIKFQSHRSRDYTNPYLPVNATAFDGLMQPVVGPDGVVKEQESNVLLAVVENMQYAVTVDVFNTVFSAFGAVQKIAIFEKNGQTQALVQYPDVATASVAKESLEGHCIYDGGYCKLHLTYSRHTDLNVKPHSDKSRDYTIPSYPAPMAPWSNPQAAPGYPPPNGYNVTQAPTWDTSSQAGRQTFITTPSTFPGQTYTSTPGSAYVSAPTSSASQMRPPGTSSMPLSSPPTAYDGQSPYYR